MAGFVSTVVRKRSRVVSVCVRGFLGHDPHGRDCGLLVHFRCVGESDHCLPHGYVRGCARVREHVCGRARGRGYVGCRHCEHAHVRVDGYVNDHGRENVGVYRPLYAPASG